MTNDEEEEYRVLISQFADSLPSKIAKIQMISSSRDWHTLRSQIHELAGTAGLYGFNEISTIARDIEIALGAQNYELVEELMSYLSI